MLRVEIDKPRMKAFWGRYKKNILAGAGILVVSLVTYIVTQKPDFYLTSVTEIRRSAPFDGTTIPIREVPDYNKIAYNEAKKMNKNEIPPDQMMPLPKYDPTDMDKDWTLLASLSNGVDLTQRKTVYTVLYLGDYAMTYQEGVAGHPGVDIVVPVGTEVYAVANGVVTVAKETTAAGKHIVLRHDDVPSLDDPNTATTYYSIYEHLSDIAITKGDIVHKGQLIGFTGNTGNSTAPHLHFQIDNNDAPWHPYWPSDFNDPSDSGSMTVHPFNWVYEYENWSSSDSSTIVNPNSNSNDSSNYSSTTTTSNTNTTTSTTIPTTDNNSSETGEITAAALQITGETQVVLGSSLALVVEALDVGGNRITDFVPTADIEMTATLDGEFTKKVLQASDFSNGRARFSFDPAAVGSGKISAQMGTAAGDLDISVLAKAGTISAFQIGLETNKLEVGVPVRVTITALDDDEQPLTVASFPGSIILSASSEGNFSPATLTTGDFENGVAQTIYTPSTSGQTKIKAQAGALIGETSQVTIDANAQIFPDVLTTHPNYQAINFLKNEGIIQGYGDGTFKPDRQVSRAEILKIILLAAEKQINMGKLSTFPDVSEDAWYSPYIYAAREEGVVKGYDDGTFQPDKTVNRAESLKIILETLGKNTPEPTTNPYPDAPVGQWFAKYAAYAKENTLIDGSLFEPVYEMTRADIAEVMYRLLK